MLIAYILVAILIAFVVTWMMASDHSLNNSDLAMILLSALVWPVGLAMIFGYLLGEGN
ncbi:putative membrane protein [Agrobacterium tumefaciens]|uniref:Membrane protein n=1 Tax=Agrobacterium tumefaciens TaxID=358 RepID=A0AAW8LPV5_AGRTU|nr:hypothetical protein [Agrobacterium tumefaciens]MBP2564515.1 putative membrane protein [Agrobacterium tumefaciens]MDR6701620.1 putative membrane protein [Agrobacterium tumefaciens]